MDFSEVSFETAILTLLAITFLGNGTFPMPVTAYVLWMGHFHTPLIVILFATLGTTLGWIFIGSKVCRLLLSKRRATIEEKLPKIYQNLFQKAPWLTIMAFNSIPFAWDPTRILAIIFDYPNDRLLSAMCCGRVIRNTILVTLGAALATYKGLFWAVLVIFLLLPLFAKGAQRWALNRFEPTVSTDELELETPV